MPLFISIYFREALSLKLIWLNTPVNAGSKKVLPKQKVSENDPFRNLIENSSKVVGVLAPGHVAQVVGLEGQDHLLLHHTVYRIHGLCQIRRIRRRQFNTLIESVLLSWVEGQDGENLFDSSSSL
jgi:hypothetical protein